MTPTLAAAIPLGIVLGLGLWSLLALIPRVGAPRLADRIAPYLVDVSPAARERASRRPAEPASLIAALLAPAASRARRLLSAVLGGDASVVQRLQQAGSTLTVQRFRSRQLLWAAGGAVIGALLATLISRVSPAGVPVLIGVVVVAAVLALLAPEQLLSRAARARLARISAELPTVVEFLTLSLSAGEGVQDALIRVSRTGNGELARELGRVAAEVNTGRALPEALQRCTTTIGLPSLSRMVDQLLGALERGTPLVEVLRAQAQDSRDETKRQLLEAAGRKEVAMLIPRSWCSRVRLPDRGQGRVTEALAGIRPRAPPRPFGAHKESRTTR